MSDKTENVIIVGSGPAGWTAAIYAARANLNPLLYEGAALQEHYDLGRGPLGQLAMTTEVENFPGFPAGDLSGYLDNAIDDSLRQYMAPHQKHGVSGPELMELMRQQAKNFGTRVVTDDIVEVDFSTSPFKLKPREGEQWLQARSVIIATGARANYLGLESENIYKNRGVSACAVCDGALPRFRNKPCVVVGGGDSAIEEADYLSKYSSVVYLVHRRDKFRASQAMVDRIMANKKVEIVWNHVVTEVLGDDQNGVTGVKLDSTVDDSKKELETSGFFLAIGHTPNTDFLKGKLDMNDAGYLKWTVPFRTNTSVEGVFAAGDVADDYYRQAITAAGTGCMSALDAERWLASQGLH